MKKDIYPISFPILFKHQKHEIRNEIHIKALDKGDLVLIIFGNLPDEIELLMMKHNGIAKTLMPPAFSTLELI
jgi:hypothetical protein